MESVVISMCDRSCVAVLPWAEAGYRCICVDIEAGPSPHPNIETVAQDIHWWLPQRSLNVVFAMAWSPCTHLAGSGARWFRQKGLRRLGEGLDLFDRCRFLCEWMGCPYTLENPVGVLSTHYRKPDHTFDPCDYAGYLDDPTPEAYTKKTCLWTGGGFVMPEPRRVFPVLGSKMHKLPPSDERAALRSVTPGGFAKAVFEANGRVSANLRAKG